MTFEIHELNLSNRAEVAEAGRLREDCFAEPPHNLPSGSTRGALWFIRLLSSSNKQAKVFIAKDRNGNIIGVAAGNIALARDTGVAQLGPGKHYLLS